jgi:thermitase
MQRSISLPALAAALALISLECAPAGAATVIVKYRSGTSSIRRTDLRRAGVEETLGTVRGQRSKIVRVGGDPARAARALKRSPGVVYAEPNFPLHVTATPNDPLFGELPDLAAINAAAGWENLGLGTFPGSGGPPIGIVDTGIDGSHEDLQGKAVACATERDGKLLDGSCADDNDHGTHVAGTAAAIANNRVGIAGVAFNSPLIVCKALGGSDGAGATADVASCIAWAHQRGAKVISLSVGGPASITLRNAVRSAWAGGKRSGSVLVAAAGNDGTDAVDYPAGYPEAVSVAATDGAGGHADFSNSNGDVEIAAPGVDVLSAKRGGGYVRFSGTSMATPHVAGAAALIWGSVRSATAASVRRRLDRAATDLGAAGRDPSFGFGLLDLSRLGAPAG